MEMTKGDAPCGRVRPLASILDHCSTFSVLGTGNKRRRGKRGVIVEFGVVNGEVPARIRISGMRERTSRLSSLVESVDNEEQKEWWDETGGDTGQRWTGD